MQKHLTEHNEENTINKQTERLSWLDVLKGIGIILVVIGHVYQNSAVFNWIYSFHMPLFFFAAGWVYKEKPILVDLKRRVQTIVVPYFSFGFLVLIYWQLIERRFRSSDMSFIDSLLGLISGEYGKLDFNVHLWFLPCFFMTVVLFNILVDFGHKKNAYIVATVMSIVYIVLSLPELLWGIDRVFKYIAFYACGTFMADMIGNFEIKERKAVKLMVALCLISVNFFFVYHSRLNGVVWFITAFLGVFACALFSKAINKNRILQYCGRISIIVLCIHGPVYRIMIKILAVPLGVSTDVVRENFLLSMIVVTITMAICCVFYEVVVRVAPWMVGKKQNAV